MTRLASRLLVCFGLAASFPAAAQDPGGPRLVTAEARRLVTMPAYPSPPIAPTDSHSAGMQEPPSPLTVESFDTATHRVYVVSVAGRIWRAKAPLGGLRSWLAFDPARRSFAELLPSIRVELRAGVKPQAIARAVDATGIEVFDTLGFAIVKLPRDLHPADAAARVEALPGQPKAALRLRRPPIEWR